MSAWMIYGATGYTGALIAREAARLGLRPVLAGRSALALETLGKELDLPVRVIALEHPDAVASGLDGISLVLNCAGPFSRTARPVMHACLTTGAHYLDITGEIDIFEYARTLDAEAKTKGIVICPGVGFDVIPTDCVAAMLKESLPGATHLSLGFDGAQTLSPGTAKTMVENLAAGGKIRRDGKIVSVPFGYDARKIDFGRGPIRAMAVPWGDVSTAYATTGIPNITVYTRAPRTPAFASIIGTVRFLTRSKAVVGFLQTRIEKSVRGPSEAARESGETLVWGEARDADGRTQRIRLQTASPYALTVTGAVAVVRRLLDGSAPAGYATPARLMGSSFVLDLPGTKLDPPAA